MRFDHRKSDDLDFFTPNWSRPLHKRIAREIRTKIGYSGSLDTEVVKPKRAKFARYYFQVSKKLKLKVELVQDFEQLLAPVGEDGIASTDDIYLRKIRTAVGWGEKVSSDGRPIPAGGRYTARNLFDLWYLSEHYQPLWVWFPKHFERAEYERLVGWLRSMTGASTVVELLNTKPGCDTRRIRQHLEEQIYERLNRVYVRT